MLSCILFRPSDAEELTLDPTTAHKSLKLSNNNRKVMLATEKQSFPRCPERFNHWHQVLCRNGLTGNGYWEVKWEGRVYVAVCYGGMRRTGKTFESKFGENNQSWVLSCSEAKCFISHNKERTDLPHGSVSKRVAVYVDCPAGILSFYSISSGTLTHLHTFHTTFTEPLYPGFWVESTSSLSLCPL